MVTATAPRALAVNEAPSCAHHTLLCHIPPTLNYPACSLLPVDWLFLHCHQGSCLAATQAFLFHHRKLMDAADENFESDGKIELSRKKGSFIDSFTNWLSTNTTLRMLKLRTNTVIIIIKTKQISWWKQCSCIFTENRSMNAINIINMDTSLPLRLIYDF